MYVYCEKRGCVYMKHQLKIFLLIICTLLLTLVSCDQNTSSLEIFGDVVIETKEGFRFLDLDWMTDLEKIKEELPDAVYTDELDRLEVHEELEGEERVTFYIFHENQFVSGEYIIVLKDKSDYESYISDIKAQAESYFAEHPPMSNTLNDLSDNQSVTWEGEDKSYFRIRPYVDEDRYSITYKVSAPQSLPKELK